ncbi:hypothetical protein EV360DRAFT_75166 [Lentinula raphanica]|nr:hypothetical protein EV360DRAFT_75166 [Lentinula raphanica]
MADTSIDPAILSDNIESTANQQFNTPTPRVPSTQPSSLTFQNLAPSVGPDGHLLESRLEMDNRLKICKKKQPLFELCNSLGVKVMKKANLEKLRDTLLEFWYPCAQHQPSTSLPPPCSTPASPLAGTEGERDNDGDDDDEVGLIQQFDQDGSGDDILAYDEDDMNDGGAEDWDFEDDGQYEAYQQKLRVDATRVAEGNRRAGGRKTQAVLVKLIEEYIDKALFAKTIRDRIIDETFLLQFIEHNVIRPKRSRRGAEITGTYLGASQQKKLFFAALRIRKEQEAVDPTLRTKRPATSVTVWDLLKLRMDMALHRARSGLVPGEDAPDIIANTFLSSITEEQIRHIGLNGFLMHREAHANHVTVRSTKGLHESRTSHTCDLTCRYLTCGSRYLDLRVTKPAVLGHLSWTSQHASGNRGDDIRALKLAELQPHILLHPNRETAIFSILGLQGEEKAGKQGLRTVINPTYMTFIAHLNPEQCPLGGFALYFHYLFDYNEGLTEKMDIDWSLNKSWRGVRVLHGPKSPTTPFSEQSMYNLYVRAFKKAEFDLPVKVHLPRHCLGYRQETMGVDPNQTSKLGWAVLGGAGYKVHETYDPPWRHVHVPERFWPLVCPMAETIHDSVVGKKNLSGAANFWNLVMDLRPYVFQCGAAIYQHVPDSNIFKLPAFMDNDVTNWMKTQFPTQLSLIQAKAGSPVDLQQIQNESLHLALEEKLSAQLDRRTQLLSPHAYKPVTKSQTFISYRLPPDSSSALLPAADIIPATSRIPTTITGEHNTDDTGMYQLEDESYRAFVSPSPKSCGIPRPRTQVDLKLPPVDVYTKPGGPIFLLPPYVGQKSISWDDVFKQVQQPERLWDLYKPTKTLDQWESLSELWHCWSVGEPEIDSNGVQTGVRPPLRLVEQYFQHKWRPGKPAGKAWERFREIPEYVDAQVASRNVSPATVLGELQARRKQTKVVTVDGVEQSLETMMGLNQLKTELATERKKMATKGSATHRTEATEGETREGGKKRAAAVAPRRPMKKHKLDVV